jgi:hypothetical protein
MTITAATFAIFTECHRCAGFKHAFANKRHVNDGRCLRCNGTMRETIVKPVDLMDTIGVRLSRADAVRVIALALNTIGAPCQRNARGEKVSSFGFTYHRGTDAWDVLADALSRCDATVRARGYRAAVVKIEGTEWKRGTAEARVRYLDECIARATGVAVTDVTAWAVDEADAVAA